ncbi:hypothetical protein HN51_012393 [Arachis hypogaea]|uniref:uncharacterized protein n=1 Tax=Arachis hypogaea TaxID=3818 RepID=UPI000DEC5F02|nr:uncharacterized protein LOC112790665 [Arachis hypogaea]
MASFEVRPLVEHEEGYSEDHQEPGSMCGSGCFQVFKLGWWQSHGEGKGLAEQKEESWLRSRLRKMKELSEVIAGPKWKTFIRKVSGYGKKQQRNRFQYDEHSYELNFNSGVPSEDEDMPPSFSARYSAPFAVVRGQTEQ